MSANRPNRPNDALANYVPVAERIEKFHERYSEGRILTTIVEHDIETGFILMRAEIYRNNDDAMPAATGHAYEVRGESFVNKTSYIENAETGSVGRALAILGFEVKRGLASREEMEKQSRVTPDTAPRPRPEPPRPEASHTEPPRPTRIEETVNDELPRAAPTLGAPATATAISGGRLPNVRSATSAETPASEEQKSEILGLLEQLRPRDRKAQRALLMEKTGKGLRDELTAPEAQRLIDELKA
ncbi:MAG: hypothetical protein MSG64_12895 [Pyrinomonadaceae bacterium MAG19_C2-C3]|nr:hypothetical protein [Pyrinomonadaceae bacterium MAG19_C2-C3]